MSSRRRFQFKYVKEFIVVLIFFFFDKVETGGGCPSVLLMTRSSVSFLLTLNQKQKRGRIRKEWKKGD